MRSKYIPLIVMLTAALVVSICTRLMRYPLEPTLWILVLTMVLFFIIGSIYGRAIRRYEEEADLREKEEREREERERESLEGPDNLDQESVSDEGEVIEKDLEETA